MNIREYSFNLQKIYDELSETFSTYQKSTGLDCISGCGRCCNYPEIEASPLEMIPLALKLFDEGKLEEWLDLLEQTTQNRCLLFLPHSADGSLGMCGSYKERPSLCRMFGVSGHLNKHQNIALSICKTIKEHYPEKVQQVQAEATADNTPLIAHGAMKLTQLDPQLGQNRMPINKALKAALEKVALYAQYHQLL